MPVILLRVLLYMVFAALLAEILRFEALHIEEGWKYSELGYTEWAQSFLLLVAVVMLALKAQRSPDYRQLAVCMALAFAVLLIRENDQTLEMVAMHGIWKYFAAIPLIAGAVYFFKHLASVNEQAARYAQTASFGLLVGGLSVLAFSRMFGRSGYWEALMGDAYMRVVKNAAEEGVEFMALALMTAAAAEFLFFDRARTEPSKQ